MIALQRSQDWDVRPVEERRPERERDAPPIGAAHTDAPDHGHDPHQGERERGELSTVRAFRSPQRLANRHPQWIRIKQEGQQRGWNEAERGEGEVYDEGLAKSPNYDEAQDGATGHRPVRVGQNPEREEERRQQVSPRENCRERKACRQRFRRQNTDGGETRGREDRVNRADRSCVRTGGAGIRHQAMTRETRQVVTARPSILVWCRARGMACERYN